jgi:hydrogenase expression/formation protein HypD
VFCNHVLTPAAMQAILNVDPASEESVEIDGFIGPSHVSVVIGSDSYAFCAGQYHKPVVIAGFEPLDVLQSILMLVRQLNEGRAEIENQYTRAVTSQGNAKAQQVVQEVFTLRPTFEWRGLGQIPTSALAISDDYAIFDAEKRFAMHYVPAAGTKGCECPAVLRGAKKPIDCKLFATACSPESPLGSCMVSDEGACAAYFTYGRFREDALQRQSQQRAAVKARRQA